MEKYKVLLILETFHDIQGIIESTDASSRFNRNARIILACNRSPLGKEYQLDINSVCDRFGLSRQTIMNIRKDFIEQGIDSLKPRSNKNYSDKSVNAPIYNFIMVTQDGFEFFRNLIAGRENAIRLEELLKSCCHKIL